MLKLQYFGPLMRRADSFKKKDSDAGKDWGQEKGVVEDEMLDSIIDSMDVSLSKLWEIVEDRGAWHAIYSLWNCRVRHDLATEQQQQQNIHHGIIYNSQLWKQPKCTQMAPEWIKKIWHRYLYYSPIKKNEILPVATIWMDLEVIMLN